MGKKERRMTIDEAINILRWLNPPRANKNSFDNFIEARQMAIDALEEQRWIPCSERLPDESGYYFVTVNMGLKKVDVVFFNKGSGFLSSNTVTAWKPRPESYQEGE
jgi:hypothetical protein